MGRALFVLMKRFKHSQSIKSSKWVLSALFLFKGKFSTITMAKLLCHRKFFNDIGEWLGGGGEGALSVLKFIWLYQMYSVSSSSILSAPPCIVNNNDRYKMKAPLILVYFLWKRKPRTQIWKIQYFYEFIGLSWGALLYF